MFLTSDFSCPRCLSHIYFATFTWNAIHTGVLRPRSSLTVLKVLIVFFTGIQFEMEDFYAMTRLSAPKDFIEACIISIYDSVVK